MEKEIPKGSGTLNIDGLDDIVDNFRGVCGVKKLAGSFEMVRHSPYMNNCVEHLVPHDDEPGASKLDMSKSSIETLPEHFSLKAKPIMFQDVENVEAFVAMSMTNDGQNVEVILIHHAKRREPACYTQYCILITL